MNDSQEDYYQCIGYCQVDSATGYCLGCGRPSAAAAAVLEPTIEQRDGSTGDDSVWPENRFPVDSSS